MITSLQLNLNIENCENVWKDAQWLLRCIYIYIPLVGGLVAIFYFPINILAFAEGDFLFC